jgi:hypothetical protein
MTAKKMIKEDAYLTNLIKMLFDSPLEEFPH